MTNKCVLMTYCIISQEGRKKIKNIINIKIYFYIYEGQRQS